MLESRRELELQSWTDVVKHGRCQARTSGNVNGQKSCSVANVERAPTGQQQEKLKPGCGKAPSVGTNDGSKTIPTQRTPVDGVRRLWGTLKIMTAAAVKSTPAVYFLS